MANSELSIWIRLRDEASKQFEVLSGKLKNFQSDIGPAAGASKVFGAALLGAGAAAGVFGVMSIKAAAESERDWAKVGQQIKLAGLDIDSTKQQIVDFATKTQKLTGISDEYIATIASRMLPTIKDVNKANELAAIALDIEASGKMNAEGATRILTLAHLGEIDALKRLLPELKTVDKATLDKMTAEQRSQMALQALRAEYGGLAEAMGGTFSGQMNRLTEAWGDFLEVVGTQFLPILTGLIEKVVPFVETTLPQWVENTKEVIKWLQEHAWVVGLIVGAIVGGLIPAFISLAISIWTTVIPAFVAGALALAPWMLGGLLIAGIVMGIMWIVKNWEMLKERMELILNALVGFVKDHWDKILIIATGGIGAIAVLVIKNWEEIKGATILIWNSIKDSFSSIWDSIKNIFQSSIDWIMNKLQPLFSAMDRVRNFNVGGFVNSIGNSLGFRAAGGPVMADNPYVVGERGPELFVPNRSGSIIPNGAVIGGGAVITLQVSGNTFMGERDIARKLGKELVDYLKLNIRV